MSEGPPSSPPSGGVAISVREAKATRVVVKRRWVTWLLLALAVVLSLGAIAFQANALLTDRSMDIPIPNSNVRPGFFENGLPIHWTCPQGHDHWSLPYWMGTLVLAGVSAILWRAWRRRTRRE